MRASTPVAQKTPTAEKMAAIQEHIHRAASSGSDRKQSPSMTNDTAPAGAPDVSDIHATGQPDTPVEVLTHLLTTALKQSNLQDTHSIVQQALDIVGGAWGACV
jgi:hypothetical protein